MMPAHCRTGYRTNVLLLRRFIMRAIILTTVGFFAVACGDGSGPGLPPRSYLMGFSAIPPRFDSSTANLIAAINNWIPHADAAIMHVSPPWAAMLGGASPDSAVQTVELPLAQYYRAKGLQVVFTVDATDGLNRAAEAPELVAAGRSITVTMVQRLYREWVYAVASRIQPDYLGLAAETNLIRLLAPDSVYRAIVTMANAVVHRFAPRVCRASCMSVCRSRRRGAGPAD